MSERCRVDPHVKILDESIVARAKARGLDALVYAPHFRRLPAIRERAARFSDEDLLVVPAREVFAGSWRERTHVLAVGLSESVPDFVSLDGAMAEFDRQDAAVLVPHPGFLNVSFDRADIRRYRDRIDAVEVYNPKHRDWNNRKARDIVHEFETPQFGSSYAHLPRSVGEVWTEFDRSISTEADLVAALRAGATHRVGRRSGTRHWLLRAAEFAHLGWENSWKKVDRVVLSGMESTHPRHPAYGGRFDDVAVY